MQVSGFEHIYRPPNKSLHTNRRCPFLVPARRIIEPWLRCQRPFPAALGELKRKTASSYPTMQASTETTRIFHFTPTQVYGAFANPKILASWWGPDGFTNEFDSFDFKPSGRWNFTMVGPNGARYANQNIFQSLTPDREIVIRHDCAPYFTLTVTLTPHPAGTSLHWYGVFDDAKVFEAIKAIVIPANDQNLNRLNRALERATAV